jgi:signal transduction histidine kinase
VKVDLGTLIDDVAELYAPLLEEAGLELETEHHTRLEVPGDRDLLFQALANLVDNALRHVPSPGRVAIRATGDERQVVLAVADDGPGIPAEARERVLERFYRLDSSRTTPGAGLGLSLVAAVADLHEAQLRLRDNHPGLEIGLVFAAVVPAQST